MSDHRFQEVARTWELADGEGRTLHVDGRVIALWRVGESFHAFDDLCPHRGASLGTEGYLNDAGHLVCAWHDWLFDLSTGRKVGPGEACLQRFPVRVEEDRVLIGVPGGP